MSTPLHLNIPEPCQEDWQKMTPNEQGRHCLSCQKTVVDFTLMSDQEILNYISNASSGVCGRFNNDQLNKTYTEKKIKPSFTFRYAWNIIMTAFLLTSNAAMAQGKKKIKKKIAFDPSTVSIPNDKIVYMTLGFVVSKEEHLYRVPIEPTLKLFGYLKDNQTRRPISTGSVRVKGVKPGIDVNSEGLFELPVNYLSGKVTLEVSAPGYLTKEYVVNVNSFQSTELYLDREETLVKQPEKKEQKQLEKRPLTTMGEIALPKKAKDTDVLACKEKLPEPDKIVGQPVILGKVVPRREIAIPVVKESAPVKPATRKITGVVIDDSTNSPVSFATVRIKGQEKGIAADEEGRFSIPAPAPKGKVSLIVSGVGYEDNAFEAAADGKQTYRVMMLPAPDQLQPVTVVAYPRISCGWKNNPPINKQTVMLDSSISILAGGVVVTRTVTITEKATRTLQHWLPVKKEVQVYPNPVVPGGMLNISLQLKKMGAYKMELMDAGGRIVQVQAIQVTQPTQVINLPTQSAWSRGIYWMRISTAGDKKVYQAKVLLQ